MLISNDSSALIDTVIPCVMTVMLFIIIMNLMDTNNSDFFPLMSALLSFYLRYLFLLCLDVLFYSSTVSFIQNQHDVKCLNS